MSCGSSEGQNNSRLWVHSLSLVKWYLWLSPCNLSTNMKLRKEFEGGKKKKEARTHYKSDSATESCLIILLIKCEPEKNSFASPRARLGWQELKAARLFHRGEQERPSVQPDKGRLKSLRSPGPLPSTVGGARILPWEETCWVRHCHLDMLPLQRQITFQ